MKLKRSFINKVEEVFEGKLEKEYKKINLTNPLLIIALFLFLFDIAYRRLNLDFSRYFKIKDRNKVKNIKAKEKNVAKDELAVEKEISNNIDKKSKVEEKTLDKKKENKSKVKKEKKKVEKTKSNTLDTSALLKKKNDRNGI